MSLGTGSRSGPPTRRKIGDLLEALAAICILPADHDQPSWLDDRSTGDVVSLANGLLDVEGRRLLSHTPRFFNQTDVPFAYQPDAPAPARWLQFLDEPWPNELDAPRLLAEWFGYVISGRLDMQKIFLNVGPTRGGKGVIARILTELVGRPNVAGPTLNSLGGEFGLAPLIGKPLAVISDARFGGRDSSTVIERLLSISGEDTLTVNRKYRDQWTGKLPSRLHIISNELPKLGDASTAIVGRILLLLTTRSWLGKEDLELERELHKELTGILNWALDGLSRLTANGIASPAFRRPKKPSSPCAISRLRSPPSRASDAGSTPAGKSRSKSSTPPTARGAKTTAMGRGPSRLSAATCGRRSVGQRQTGARRRGPVSRVQRHQPHAARLRPMRRAARRPGGILRHRRQGRLAAPGMPPRISLEGRPQMSDNARDRGPRGPTAALC
jgi:P4 family phage/plasmid primase-like protien